MSDVPSWCRVGAAVVCVRWDAKDDALARYFDIKPLVEGQRYTIRGVDMRPGGLTLLLDGVSNPPNQWFDFEMAYAHDRFRPAVEDKSDNEIEAQIYHSRDLKVTGSKRVRERT